MTISWLHEIVFQQQTYFSTVLATRFVVARGFPAAFAFPLAFGTASLGYGVAHLGVVIIQENKWGE